MIKYQKEPDSKKKMDSGGCSIASRQQNPTSDAIPNADVQDTTNNVTEYDPDYSMNQMLKQTYTVYQAADKATECPIARRDNLADQFTP